MSFFAKWWLAPVLFLTGLVAGFVDSIAGGGGLITMPVLLGFNNFNPKALATNKLQATFGSASAAWNYSRLGAVSLRECKLGIVMTIMGAAIGTLLVQQLDPHFLRRALPVLLVSIAIFMFLKPQLGAKDIHPRLSHGKFYVVMGLALGFYDGFFGPGTGAFWSLAFMLGLGFNLTKATGYTKVMNFASNLTSLVFFFRLLGPPEFAAGLTMGIGQLIGARIGSHMVVNRGTKFIRPIFITVVIIIAVKLLLT
jgi:uncharacterized protein